MKRVDHAVLTSRIRRVRIETLLACLMLLLAALGPCSGPSRAEDSQPSKKAPEPWWVVARTGGFTFQAAYGSPGGFLAPVEEWPGGIGVGMKEGLYLGVGAGRRLNRWLAVEASLSRFYVEMGGDDLFQATGETVPVEIGTGSVNAVHLTLLFDGRTIFDDLEPSEAQTTRFSHYLGVDLLHLRPGDLTLSEPGRSRLGVVAVETRSAVIYGLSLRGDIRIGPGPWAVTLNSTLTFGGEKPFEVRTDPEAGYLSSEVPFRPLTLTVGFLRRI
jgi:hypothetical protein